MQSVLVITMLPPYLSWKRSPKIEAISNDASAMRECGYLVQVSKYNSNVCSHGEVNIGLFTDIREEEELYESVDSLAVEMSRIQVKMVGDYIQQFPGKGWW